MNDLVAAPGGVVMDAGFLEAARHRREILRRLRNFDFELTDLFQVLLPAMGITIGGTWSNLVRRAGQIILPWEHTPNIIPNEGLDYALDVALSGGSQLSGWYIAPFSGNVTPGASYTAANFTSNATEFTNYDEAARVAWSDGGVSGQSVDNSASTADFTIASGGGTVYGAGLLSASAKSATTGKLFAAAKFASSRTLAEDDTLSIQYTLSASSA